MATLFYAKVSSIEYEAGTVTVALTDRENQIIEKVPCLSAFYEMPEPGDTVAALFEEIDHQIGKGIILGKMYEEGNEPLLNGQPIFQKVFKDQTSMTYDLSQKRMTFDSETIEVQDLETKNVTSKEIKVDKLICKELVQG